MSWLHGISKLTAYHHFCYHPSCMAFCSHGQEIGQREMSYLLYRTEFILMHAKEGFLGFFFLISFSLLAGSMVSHSVELSASEINDLLEESLLLSE